MIRIDSEYRKVQPGLWWNRKSKTAIFDVSVTLNGEKKRKRQVQRFEKIQDAQHAFIRFRDLARGIRHLPISPPTPTLHAYIDQHWDAMHAGLASSTWRAPHELSQEI